MRQYYTHLEIKEIKKRSERFTVLLFYTSSNRTLQSNKKQILDIDTKNTIIYMSLTFCFINTIILLNQTEYMTFISWLTLLFTEEDI